MSPHTPGAHEADTALNACVIAAAPDLLAALELLVRHHDRDGDAARIIADSHDAWTAARAAIATALGEEAHMRPPVTDTPRLLHIGALTALDPATIDAVVLLT